MTWCCVSMFLHFQSRKNEYRKNSYAHIKEQVKSSLIYFSSTCEVIIVQEPWILMIKIFLVLNFCDNRSEMQ